jgi:large-conductance mechanosensitive channel
MPRLSPIDAFSPAFERTKMMLLRPFRLKTWLKLGFIGWLGGGLVTASANFNFRGGVPQFPHDQFPEDPWAKISQAIHSIHLANFLHAYLHFILAALAVVVAISLVFLYLFCRFRFILFDVVVSGQPVIGRGWHRYAPQANRYFGFWFVYALVNWAAMVLIIGMPIWHAYKSGAFSGDNSFLAFLEVIGSIALGVIAASIVFGIVSTLAKDFILPLMALDDLPLGEAWSQLWRVISSEPGAWAGYLGMKLLLAFGAGIGFSIAFVLAMLVLILVLAIPVGSRCVEGGRNNRRCARFRHCGDPAGSGFHVFVPDFKCADQRLFRCLRVLFLRRPLSQTGSAALATAHIASAVASGCCGACSLAALPPGCCDVEQHVRVCAAPRLYKAQSFGTSLSRAASVSGAEAPLCCARGS